MRLRNILRALKGEFMLTCLWCLRVICLAPGLVSIYRAVVSQLVEKTCLFDEQYYLENNPDIAESGMNALSHYVVYGDSEGRAPVAVFDPNCYRKSTTGWTKRINTLLHFSYVGCFCKTTPSPWFDVEFYLKNNKDVARAGINPLLHYLEWGGMEGRSPCAQFDGAYYLRKNPDVSEASVNPLIHYLKHGRYEGRRTVPAYYPCYPMDRGENVPVALLPDKEEWQAVEAKAHGDNVLVDVVIPVYKGRAETLRCIYSVLASRCETPYELIVLNDASPDESLVEDLSGFAARGMFTLIENDKNLGFVQTVNRGLTFHDDRDIVILNSDTEVYAGWLDRLKVIAEKNVHVGTVTPLSNNATICSYPYFLHDNPYPLEIPYSELDGVLAVTNSGVTVEAPTGVGFCMFIKRDCLDMVGLLDEKTFGKGYGEENDFCQRAIKQGWQNVIATDVFVRHWGSVSFQGEKAVLANNALKLVKKKHPNYLADVAEFIQREPLGEIYRQIDWARLLRLKQENNVLLLCHGRGGGTEKRFQEDIEYYTREGYGIYLMRPAPGEPHKVTIGHPEAKWLPNMSDVDWHDTEGLKRVVEELGITEVVSHSFVDWIKEAPVLLKQLVTETKIDWVMHVHDYEMICPRLNLVDDKGYYCNEPDDAGCNHCLVMCGTGYGETDISNWRRLHGEAMAAATRIVVPDQDVRERLAKYYPAVSVKVRPHERLVAEDVSVNPMTVGEHEKLRVVVIGAINNMKGFNVLLRCARDAAARKLPLKFILMGYSMNDRVLEEAGVEVTGKYQETDALARLHDLAPHLVWIPSLWPETYCYTLSIGLKGRYPVMSFDIGAVARRLRECRDDTYILPLALGKRHAEVNTFLTNIRSCAVERVVLDEEEQDGFSVAVAAYE